MILLALDLGTKTGWCAGEAALHATGVQNFSPRRHEGGGMRILRFQRWLDEIHAARGIQEVVYEEVRRHNGVDAAHVYGGLMGALTAWCEARGVPYAGVPVGTIKKFATGKGNASKDDMLVAVRSWVQPGVGTYDPADDNEADAIALFWHRTAETEGVMPVVKEQN